MLSSVLLSNSETWLRLTQTDIRKIERVDHVLLRKIFHAPRSTPVVALYLETGCVPMPYYIKMKRIMFMHYILSREGDPLIKTVYSAQVRKTAKGDWCVVVKEDLNSIGLGYLDDEKIACMKKDALKQIVTEKIKETALRDLQAEGKRGTKETS